MCTKIGLEALNFGRQVELREANGTGWVNLRGLLLDLDDIARGRGLGSADDAAEFVPPVDLSGEVGLTSHEGVTHFCKPLDVRLSYQLDPILQKAFPSIPCPSSSIVSGSSL
jgi:hypothetical protein